LIIIYKLAQSYGGQRNEDEMMIADMITIAFYFILRPCKNIGTISEGTPLWLQYTALYIGI
jgi:hypothetical protein